MSLSFESIVYTYLLIMPYLALTFYFAVYQRDDFFLKTRSSVQFLYVLIFLGFIFINLLLWKWLFREFEFLGFSIQSTKSHNKSTGLITILAAIAAVCGWIFTARVQTINAIKGHSMQVLMNSRTSTIYMQKVDKTIEIRRGLTKESMSTEGDKQDAVLTAEKFEKLGNGNGEKADEEKSAVIYMLNFLEFVAIGIRHYNLDESLLKGSLRSIINSNYKLYKPVIDHLRRVDNPKIFTQFELLHDRWTEPSEILCTSCRCWHPKKPEKQQWKDKYDKEIKRGMGILTFGSWQLALFIIKQVKKITKGQNLEEKLCKPCLENTNRKTLDQRSAKWLKEPKISINPAKIGGIRRKLVLIVEASEKGRITKVSIGNSSGMKCIDVKVVRVVKKSKLKPHQVNGKNCPIVLTLHFEFHPKP